MCALERSFGRTCDGEGDRERHELLHGQIAHPALRRLFFMKSIMMYCPRVMVLVKYALPRAISDTFCTN